MMVAICGTPQICHGHEGAHSGKLCMYDMHVKVVNLGSPDMSDMNTPLITKLRYPAALSPMDPQQVMLASQPGGSTKDSLHTERDTNN